MNTQIHRKGGGSSVQTIQSLTPTADTSESSCLLWRFLKMAAAKDGCGLETAAGNGRRLHLGIPEAVFVVRNCFSVS